MPKLLIYQSIWIFTIFGTDRNKNRMHVHVGRKGTFHLCKVWLEPEVAIADSGELTVREQREIIGIVTENLGLFLGQWEQFRNGQKVNLVKIN
jgi:hypothetical protein